jgi:hypothetical protein
MGTLRFAHPTLLIPYQDLSENEIALLTPAPEKNVNTSFLLLQSFGIVSMSKLRKSGEK